MTSGVTKPTRAEWVVTAIGVAVLVLLVASAWFGWI